MLYDRIMAPGREFMNCTTSICSNGVANSLPGSIAAHYIESIRLPAVYEAL